MSRSIEHIKKRIWDMKEKIAETEERESNAKQLLVDANARQQRFESEVMAQTNRVGIVKELLEKTINSYNEKLSLLEENCLRSQESEDNRTRLQDKENEGSESLDDLEITVKNKRQENEELQNKCRECEARESKLKDNLSVLNEKCNTSTEKGERLEKEAIDQGTTTRDIENKVNGYHEREDDYKERITALNDQISQLTTISEEREARKKTSERYVEKLAKDVEMLGAKMREVEMQFEEIEQDI